jgi:hypothetical protein
VTYLDVVAASVCLIPFVDDLTATDGVDGGAGGGCIVDSVVRTVALQYGVVTTVGKARGDAVVVKRSFQEGPLQTVSLLVVIELFPLCARG